MALAIYSRERPEADNTTRDERHMKFGWVPERLKDSGGFALPMAVFVLIILAVIAAGGSHSAAQEIQIGRGMRSFTYSFYAAETGIQEVVSTWEPYIYNALQAGDSLIVGPVTLEGGGSYTTTVVRVGAVADSTKRYFYIESTGRPPGPRSGERSQAVIGRVRLFTDLCCEATVKNSNQIQFEEGTAQISGLNNDPPGSWPAAACTDYPPDSVPGVKTKDQNDIDDPSLIVGWPIDYVEDTTITQANLFTFDDITYDDMVKLADHVFIDDKDFTGSVPSVTASGKCNRADPNNWGAPDNPSHPCFNYFPIINVQGDLTLTGSGSAQGILLIGGDADSLPSLEVEGPFDFYGLTLVKQDVELDGPVRIFGGAIVGEDIDFEGTNPRILYSRCAIQRALRLSNLARLRLLPARAWVEF